MEFIVSRKTVSLTGSRKPCSEAQEKELTPLDYRTVGTLEEAKKKIWYNDWMEAGIGHREEGGIVVCDKKIKEKQWVININSLEELIDFQKKYGEIMVLDSAPFRETRTEVKILSPE
jgi:hypothetical protein